MRLTFPRRALRACASATILAFLCASLMAGCGTSTATPVPTAQPASPTVAVSPTARRPKVSDTPVIAATPTPIPTYVLPTASPVPAKALALRVDGRPIYLSEYMRMRDGVLRGLWQQYHPIDPLSSRVRPILSSSMRRVREDLVSREVVLAYAATHHLAATPQEIAEQVASDGGQQRLDARLAAQGSTMAAYTARITVLKAEYYLVDHHDYRQTEYHVRYIVLPTLSGAQQVRTLLLAKRDFAQLAAANSLDKGTSSNGGDLGYLTADALGPLLAPVVAALPLNTPSQPVRTIHGYNIIEVLAVLKDVPLSGKVLNQAKLAYFQQWYAARRHAAHVETFVKPD